MTLKFLGKPKPKGGYLHPSFAVKHFEGALVEAKQRTQMRLLVVKHKLNDLTNYPIKSKERVCVIQEWNYLYDLVELISKILGDEE